MRRVTTTLTGIAVTAGVVVTATPAGAVPAAPSRPSSVTVVGHGWGHGRGMGQWGALGYAVDRGWSSARILDHFYGGTHSRFVGDPQLSVELTHTAGAPVTVTGRALRVNGRSVGGAVRINRLGRGRIRVSRGNACTGRFTPWFIASTVGVVPVGKAADAAAAVRVCVKGGAVGYHGVLRMFDGGNRMRTVNVLSTESYLAGVVPREVPAAWGDLGRGRGMQALAAQAVAARSYVLSSRRRWSTTCDSTACQVYGGWFTVSPTGVHVLQDRRSDAAVAATRGLVRAWPTGAVARTEFSSSSGGFTAGGAFRAVRDSGDAIGVNPRHDWRTSFTWDQLTGRLGLGAVNGITVSRREYVDHVPTRAVQVRVTRANGTTVTLSGADIRGRLGLDSDWISFLQHRS